MYSTGFNHVFILYTESVGLAFTLRALAYNLPDRITHMIVVPNYNAGTIFYIGLVVSKIIQTIISTLPLC